jgi:hypothetical protein
MPVPYFIERHRAAHAVRFHVAEAAQSPARAGFCSMLSFVSDTGERIDIFIYIFMFRLFR